MNFDLAEFFGSSPAPARTAWILRAMLVLCVWLSAEATAAAAVQITISYTYVTREVSPQDIEHRLMGSIVITVARDHKIRILGEIGNKYSTDREATLGIPASTQSVTGRDGVSRARIDNGAIILSTFYPSYSAVTRITTNGVDSCQASTEYKLAKGHKYFEVRSLSTHEDMLRSEIRRENETCSISTTSD